MRRLAVAILMMIAAAASPAMAQTDPRVQLVLDGGAQVASGSFGQQFTLTRNVEDAPVTTDLNVGASGFIEAGARVRVAGPLLVGIVGFYTSGKADGSLAAQIPHPFYFEQRRAVSGDLSALKRTESGAHIELAYPVAATDAVVVTLFGGPSYINARQDLVTDLSYSESYPYDTATFTGVTTVTASKGALGFNAGGEVRWQATRTFGVAAIVRYAHAGITLSPAEGNVVALDAGALQIGAGVRIGF
jgi:hypothetical protein